MAYFPPHFQYKLLRQDHVVIGVTRAVHENRRHCVAMDHRLLLSGEDVTTAALGDKTGGKSPTVLGLALCQA